MRSIGEMLIVFALSFGACLVAGIPVVRWLGRTQRLAPLRYEDCPPLLAYQHTKRQVPTMGGLFLLGTAITVAVWRGALGSQEGWWVFGAILATAGLGLADDWMKFAQPNGLGIRTRPKLFIALAIGALLGAAIVRNPVHRVWDIPWTGRGLDMGWWSVPGAMLVFAGSAHAVNLTDGMDGLAAGCVAIALSVLGIWALEGDEHSHSLATWCISLAGACIGFLWFNSFPASIFMGDVGALGLGAGLGAVALLTHTALWLLILGGIFVAEAGSVMLQVASYRWRGGHRLFRVAPLHHHVHLGGLHESHVVMRFWLVALMLAILCVLSRGVLG